MSEKIAAQIAPDNLKLAVVMVGLPARGKSYTARRIERYLSWLGYRTRVFNVGEYRRARVGAQLPHSFFDPDNPSGEQARRSVAMAALDVSGRPFIVFDADLTAGRLGEYEVETTEEFFRAFAFAAGLTLHLRILYGRNAHHQIEALFKACGRALRQAVAPDPRESGVPSTKGVL